MEIFKMEILNMREIKFRVWDNLKKKWVSNKDIWRIRTNNEGIGSILPPAIYWKQHPQGLAIQQFTGLKDKDGREIYEGDIISYPFLNEQKREIELYKSIVSFEDGCFGFLNQSKSLHLELKDREIEILGNICENPELLK